MSAENLTHLVFISSALKYPWCRTRALQDIWSKAGQKPGSLVRIPEDPKGLAKD